MTSYFSNFASPNISKTNNLKTPEDIHQVDNPKTSYRAMRGSISGQLFGSIDSGEIVLKHLWRMGVSKFWFPSSRSASSSPLSSPNSSIQEAPQDASVALKIGGTSGMRCYPPAMDGAFARAVQAFDFKVVMKVESDVVIAILDLLSTNDMPIYEVPLNDGTRIQVIDNMSLLPRVRKAQQAAFVRAEKALVVWSNSTDAIVAEVCKLEEIMIACVYTSSAGEKSEQTQLAIVELNAEQLESQAPKPRGEYFIIPFIAGTSIALLMTLMSFGIRSLVRESAADGNYIRFALIAVLPFMALFSLFFCIVIVQSFVQVFGPVSQLNTNSIYYSAQAPIRTADRLPHITIQCPVYRESLVNVIEPTMASVRQAITVYELQGGTASIFCNDDGMQLLSPEDAALRQKYFERNNIAWIARPRHDKDNFIRAGKFKKASNMNFALNIAYEYEKELSNVDRDDAWDAEQESQAETTCFASVMARNPEAWAAGDIRLGDLILLVDSDTRVPRDCLLDAACEFSESPDIAILQHSSGVMQVVHNYWENCIAHFTQIIYSAIRYSCASGDIAPFVGHNAFLRWSAIQELGHSVEQNGKTVTKWWSEEHVSEDFEMALKLQILGYKIRLASYSRNEFLEGVSLTVYDEIARWEKYAYGCSELVFNPLKSWFTKGPFTKLFKIFLGSQIAGISKLTVVSYIFSYYAIASAWPLIAVNYFMIGWYAVNLDDFYVPSWDIFLAVIFVFGVFTTLCRTILNHRTRQGTSGFFDQLIKNFGWAILLSTFLGGLALHVAAALLSHMFSINRQWGATAKELEKSNFWIELPKVARSYKWTYLFLTIVVAGMIILATSIVPAGWQIKGVYTCMPLGWLTGAHIVTPVLLNPQLMTFSF